jgi:hypothetical protein
MIDFQHLHPTQVANGSWATPLKLHEAGSYRVFADFSTGGRPYVLADDLLADGTVAWQALTAPTFAADIDGFRIQLDEGTARPAEESQLEFAVTRNGRPAQLQDYLGATAGTYRLFLQFKVDDGVHTAAFMLEVSW